MTKTATAFEKKNLQPETKFVLSSLTIGEEIGENQIALMAMMTTKSTQIKIRALHNSQSLQKREYKTSFLQSVSWELIIVIASKTYQ